VFNLTSLRYFLIAAEEMSFTKAAKRLFISQQALSGHIVRLEEYYGVKLFNRGASLSLTDAGRALQRHAKDIFDSVSDCEKEVQDIKNFRQGELTIGVPVTRGTIMLPPLISAFHQLFPQIKINLLEAVGSSNIINMLYDGSVDLYIGYQPDDISKLAVVPLFEEKFVIMVPNRLLKQYFPKHSQETLGNGPLPIDLFSEIPFVVQDKKTMNGQVFEELCNNAGITPNIVLSTQNLITLASLAIEGVGACVLPYTFLSPAQRLSGHGNTPLFSEEGLARLSVFELYNSTQQTFQISVFRLRNKVLTRAGKEFILLAQEIFGNIPTGQIPPQFRPGYDK